MKLLATLLAVTAFGATAVAGPAKKEPPKKETPKPAPPVVDPEPPATPFPASSDPRRIIGILDVRIDGAPAEVGVQFQRDLEAQVDTKHYFLAPRVRMHDRLANSTKWTEGCVVGDCLREVKVQTNADVVLLASLTGSGTSYGWVVTLVGTERGKVVGQTSERCDVCTVSEALAAATRATVALLDHVPEDLRGEPEVRPAKPIDQPVPAPQSHNLLGTVLTIAGIAVAAAGTAYYFANSHDKNGLVIAGAGGGLLVGGVVTLTF
ncbi:MAG TPA: hypothetical protein VFQ65_03620 [Kofleriaceae bacterium]|nr:hypothetical protein [Kofleriaceae bacterium]